MSEVNNKTLQNSMQAVYEIKTVPAVHIEDNSDTGVALEVFRIVEGESTANVSIERVNARKSEKQAKITAKRENTLTKEPWIRTPNQNCLQAPSETQRPEELSFEFEATIDSFTKREPPFNIDNFGDSSTLLVSGESEKERETFIRFELPLWFLPVVSIGTKMRLYYRGTITYDDKLVIHRNSRTWGEYSITHANSPNKEEYVTSEFTINDKERYIEFDLTELVNDWKLKPDLNFGINISSSDSKRFSFYSRESVKPPLLLGTFFDPNIKSLGRATREALIEVVQSDHNDKLVVIEPKPYYTTNDKDVQIKFYEKGGHVPNDVGAQITVTKPYLNVELGVYELHENDKSVIINNLKKHATVNNVQLAVTRTETKAIIDIPNSSNKETIINVQGISDKEAELEVVYCSDTEVDIEAIASSQKNAQITVSRKAISTELFVAESDDKEVSILPKVSKASDQQAQITSTKRTKEVIITPKVKYSNDIEVELNAKGWERSSANSEITVTRSDAMVELMAHKSIEDREVELYVNDTVDKEAIIEAIASSSKNVNLNIVEVNDTNTQITVTKVKTNAQIGVYFEQDSEPIVEITPIMKRTSNRQVNISVKGDNVGYAFIM